MEKQCKICGAIVPDNAKFCQKCGGNEFVAAGTDDEQTGLLNESGNPYQNQPVQPQPQAPVYTQPQFNQPNGFNNQQNWQQPPVPQNQPKKKNTGLIVAIVVICLIVLAGIGMAAEKIFQEQGYGDGDSSSDSGYNFNIGTNDDSSDDDVENDIDNSVTIEYTKGTFDGATYINEWADIKLVLPSGFSNADSDTYSASENESTDCGAYFMADDTMSLIYICYEKLPSFPVYDEEDYLDAVMNSLKNQTGITYEIDEVYSTTNIAGYAYATAECNFNNGYGDFVQSIYVRKIDGYMAFISAISNSTASNNVLVNNITTAN